MYLIYLRGVQSMTELCGANYQGFNCTAWGCFLGPFSRGGGGGELFVLVFIESVHRLTKPSQVQVHRQPREIHIEFDKYVSMRRWRTCSHEMQLWQ